MAMSRGKNAEPSNNIQISNRSFERVERFRYFGTTLTYQNYTHEKIKNRYVRKRLLSFGAESFVFQFVIQKYKDYDIQNYKFFVVLYGCETWSLREECRLRVFDSRALRNIFGPKK